MKKQSMIIVIILFMSTFLYSLDLKSKEYDLGFMVGLWMGGDVNIEGYSADKDGCLLIRGFADAYLIPKLAMGAYFNFSPATIETEDITVFEFGGSIKPRFLIREDLAIKPGLNIGYRTASGDEPEIEMDGFALNLSIEVQKAMETMILSFEGGFLSQPAGGNEWVEISWAPIMYLGAGLTF
ncbi:MAG: hypothetical protein JXR69_05520 [Candidatus Delongbacteria bacterium]|nr:hypothetical protein [Candidatus Delongbacteria bacterium]